MGYRARTMRVPFCRRPSTLLPLGTHCSQMQATKECVWVWVWVYVRVGVGEFVRVWVHVRVCGCGCGCGCV